MQKSIGILICFGNTRRFWFRKNKTPKQALLPRFVLSISGAARSYIKFNCIFCCCAFELQRFAAVAVVVAIFGHSLRLCVCFLSERLLFSYAALDRKIQ